jgi:hypothetical protein
MRAAALVYFRLIRFQAAIRFAGALSVALLAGTSGLVAQTIDVQTSFDLRRGVIVDGGREAIYLCEPGGAIEAVDLSAGRLLWSSTEAALPLTLDGHFLVAQTEETRPGRLPIAVLDVDAGGRRVIEAVIPLPDDIRATIADDQRRSFRVTALRDEDGFLISWTYTEHIIEGSTRDPQQPMPTHVVTGAAHVDLATARVVPVAATTVSRVRTDAAAERIKSIEGLAQTPVRTGSVLSSVQGGRGGPLTLKRWDAVTGVALPDRELLQKAIVALPSADQSVVLGSERVGEGGPEDPEYRWSIFSLETGERLAEIRRDVSAAPFFIWDSNVVFESRPYGYRIGEVWVDEPLKIRAVRFSRGVPVWDRAVRHLEYRGPVPPAR